MATSKHDYLTLREFADRFRMSHSSALALVYRGIVRAVDISSNPDGRSRFVVPREAVEEFEVQRAVNVAPPVKTSRRRKLNPSNVIEYIQ